MSERYTKLTSLPGNQYISGAPVLLSAGSLLKDSLSHTVLVQLKFQNISEKTVKAATVNVDAFDISGAGLEGVKDVQYLDFSAQRDEMFGQRQAISLPDPNTRSVAVHCTRVVFSDGTKWEADASAVWSPLPEQTPVIAKLSPELAEQYRHETSGSSIYEPETRGSIWRCACGAVNQTAEENCHVCGSSLNALLAAYDSKALQAHFAAFDMAKKEKAKKRGKTATIIVVAVAAATAAAVLISGAVRKNKVYKGAIALAVAGQYEKAIEMYEMLGGYRDSDQRIKDIYQTEYDQAIELLNGKQYEESRNLFLSLGGYKDSEQHVARFQWTLIEKEEQFYSVKKENGIWKQTGKGGKNCVFSYDEKGKMLTEEGFSTETGEKDYIDAYEYNEDGNLIRIVSYSNLDKTGKNYGTVITREYDGAGHLISYSAKDNKTGSVTRDNYENHFDETGRLVWQKEVNPDPQKGFTYIKEYDQSGRLIVEERKYNNSQVVNSITGSNEVRIEYTYDETTLPQKIEYFGKNHQFVGEADLEYRFNEQGAIIYSKVTLPDGSSEEHVCDENGYISKLTIKSHGWATKISTLYYEWRYFSEK